MYIIVVFFETCAGLAQLVEQWNHNPRVIGPNPIPGTIFDICETLLPKRQGFFVFLQWGEDFLGQCHKKSKKLWILHLKSCFVTL